MKSNIVNLKINIDHCQTPLYVGDFHLLSYGFNVVVVFILEKSVLVFKMLNTKQETN